MEISYCGSRLGRATWSRYMTSHFCGGVNGCRTGVDVHIGVLEGQDQETKCHGEKKKNI